MVQEAPLKIYVRGVVSYFYFSRARAENKANQQCHFKSSRCPMEQLGTDSCRGTVPMEPPMPNCSMGHQNPDLDFDDTRMILQGASCTIAACYTMSSGCPNISALRAAPYAPRQRLQQRGGSESARDAKGAWWQRRGDQTERR
jgi:hypothetical protein